MSRAASQARLRTLLEAPAPAVGPALLGARLTTQTPEGVVSVELTEVEAYDGESDPASHAYRGRTSRNAVMFGPAGRLYVYFSYGMHWCANVVTGADGAASAVLLRAGRVVEGLDLARARRGPRVSDRGLARGPACLTQALGIGRAEYGLDLLDLASPVRLSSGRFVERAGVASGPRVGVSVAAGLAWRYWIRDDDTVSTYKRSPRAPVHPPG